MSPKNHHASFYRLAHFTAELARRNPALDWANSKALQLRSSTNYMPSASEMLRDSHAINFESLTYWKTDDILFELIQHCNSMVLSVSGNRNNSEPGIELANLVYRLTEFQNMKTR